MTEKETQNPRQTLGLSRPGKLELKKTVESGEVRQSFSHGRSKAVQVQVKKKRTFKRGQTGGMKEVAAPEVALESKAETFVVAKAAPAAARPATLTDTERAARVEAVRGALEAQVEEKVQAEEESRRHAEEEARLAKDAAEAEARRVAGEAVTAEAERLRLEAEVLEAQKSADVVAKAPAKKDSKPASEDRASPRRREAEGGAAAAARRKGDARRLSISRRGEPPRRRSGKMTVVQALSEHERQRSLASMRRQREREKRAAGGQTGESRKVVREVVLPETITVQELANRMAVRGAEVIKALMKMDVMATINQTIDTDTAELIVNEFGHRIKRVSESDVEIGLRGAEDDPETLRPRPPVVTVMGHVDHGKTSLLDALRESDVASGEAGGITQHIAAYQVTMTSGEVITFLDTPGHEAFTQMRSRGAKATDLVVLVVAADDGVMPQTIEAIQHAQAAEVPMIIAINKMDRPDANPDKVKNELLQHNVVVESMGGDVLTVEISAKEKTNLDKLEEVILLQAELLELKANPDRSAEGVVLEAKRDRGRGIVTTILVQRGTLRIGDIVVAGAQWGKVRAMVDDHGSAVKEAYPSQPVEVLGLNDTPLAGDEVGVVDNESRAREIAEYRQDVIRRQETVAAPRGSVDEMFSRIAQGETKELPIVIKADVQGSLEAIKSSLSRFDTEEVAIRFLLAGVGGINESDISLGNSSKALVIGFNVRADAPARAMARRDGLDIRYYSVIYELIEDMTNMLTGMLAPRIRENFIGYARVKQVFNITKVGKIAGCEVTEGVVRRGAKVRLLRDNVVIHEGTLSILKRHKDEVAEVRQGLECGMAFENYHDLKEGDMIEAFELEEIARKIGD